MLAPPSAFHRLWSLGYRRIVPVIPPGAEISPHSTLYKRVGTRQDARGKLPGTRGREGLWSSWDWTQHRADPEDFPRWAGMGAGAGIITGDGLLALDADTLNERLAEAIRDVVRQRLGDLPIRVGRYPKALYLLRVSGSCAYRRIDFGEADAHGNFERVELLSDRKFFVAEGIHPKTLKPYTWPKPLAPFDDLPVFAPEAIDALMEALRAVLPAASKVQVEGGGDAVVNQEALRGDPAVIAKAVRATPNTSALFPTREHYRDYGYAIKAAVPDEREAFALWAEWCDRWDEGTNEPGIMEADWRRMKPPFRRGASWLYETAEKASGGAFTSVEAHFTPIEESAPSPFDTQARAGAADESAPQIAASPYTFPDPASMPKRQWIYGTHLIRKFVSATVAPSGVGKSSLVIGEALAMVSGKPLLGVQPKGQFRVWLWNGEDPLDELQRRVAAVMLHYGLTREDVGDRLFLDSGRHTEIILAKESRDGAVIAAPVVAALLETLRTNRIDVMQVDPFVSSHRVSENDNGAIDMVSKQWARIADATGCAVDLVHHVRKLNGAEITVEDSRGAVSLIATSRSARALTKMQKGEAARLGIESRWQRFFRFGDGKNNLAPPAGEGALASGWMELVSVSLGNGEGDGLERMMDGDSVGVVFARSVAEMEAEGSASVVEALGGAAGGVDLRQVALEAVREGGGLFRRDIRAGDAWVGAPIARAMRLDVADKTDRGRINALIAAWLRDGTLQEVTRPDAKRMLRTYVEVTPKAHTSTAQAEDVFQ
jgi:hypothetical protein